MSQSRLIQLNKLIRVLYICNGGRLQTHTNKSKGLINIYKRALTERHTDRSNNFLASVLQFEFSFHCEIIILNQSRLLTNYIEFSFSKCLGEKEKTNNLQIFN